MFCLYIQRTFLSSFVSAYFYDLVRSALCILIKFSLCFFAHWIIICPLEARVATNGKTWVDFFLFSILILERFIRCVVSTFAYIHSCEYTKLFFSLCLKVYIVCFCFCLRPLCMGNFHVMQQLKWVVGNGRDEWLKCSFYGWWSCAILCYETNEERRIYRHESLFVMIIQLKFAPRLMLSS